MALFTGYPTYPKYRTLQLGDRGEDVYALQIALNWLTAGRLVKDGYFGPFTNIEVVKAQGIYGIAKDGKAGGETQKRLAVDIATEARKAYQLPTGLLYGQIQQESGFRLGIYSPQRSDGGFDAGVVQRNSKLHPLYQAFDPVQSINLLAKRIRTNYDRYSTVLNQRRRWGLAAGSWNAPAYADWYAGLGGVKPSETARERFEEYISKVTLHMVL